MRILPMVPLVACFWVSGAHSVPLWRTLYESMKSTIAVETQIVWDIGNQAQDDAGNPDAARLKAADWQHLIEASQEVMRAAQALAQSNHLTVAAPGQKLDGEGNPGAFNAQQVQTVVDAKPQVFRAFAQSLAQSMEQITAAARARDAAKLTDVAGQVDQICEQCHTQFWYPNQKSTRSR